MVVDMTTTTLAEGDRIYATEDIVLDDDVILAGSEGTIARMAELLDVDLMIEWDLGVLTGADSGSVALIPT